MAFFTLFHSPSGAGCTPKGRDNERERKKESAAAFQLVCGPSRWDPAWGMWEGDVPTHLGQLWKFG